MINASKMFFRICMVTVIKNLWMQNSLQQKVFPSFETDKKWTGGRQNADKHPDQNLTGLVSKYITKGLPDPVWI